MVGEDGRIKTKKEQIKMKDTNKYHCLTIENSTWIFFNIYGIEISKSKNWKNFIFNDCTVVNRSQFLDYINSISSHKDFLSSYLNGSSVIIVEINKILTHLDSSQRDEYFIKAKNRSEEVASLLFFVFSYLTRFHYGISLQHQVYDSKGLLNIQINTSLSLTHSVGLVREEHLIVLPKLNYSFTRGRLISILNKKLFKSLTKCIIKPNSNNRVLVNALRNFYKTINVPSNYSQFLGSITTIELLLKSNGYELAKDRVRIILNDKIFKDYFMITSKRSLFNLRHDLIHESKEIETNSVLKAFISTSYILLCYSRMLEWLNTKENINNYLDVISKERYLFSKGAKISFNNKEYFEKLLSKNEFYIDIDLYSLLHKYYINGTTNNSFKKSFVLMTYLYSKIKSISLESAFTITKEFCIHHNSRMNYNWFNLEYQLNKLEIESKYTEEIAWINYTYGTNYISE